MPLIFTLLKAATKRTAEKACQTRKSAFLRGERTWAYVTRIKRCFDKVSRALYAAPLVRKENYILSFPSVLSPTYSVWRRYSYITTATEFDRLSDLASARMGMRKVFS